jgi:hypothetical protein
VARLFLKDPLALERTGLGPADFELIEADIMLLQPSQLMTPHAQGGLRRPAASLVYSFDPCFGPEVLIRKELLLRFAKAFRVLTCKKEFFENKYWKLVGQRLATFFGGKASITFYCFERVDLEQPPRRPRPTPPAAAGAAVANAGFPKTLDDEEEEEDAGAAVVNKAPMALPLKRKRKPAAARSSVPQVPFFSFIKCKLVLGDSKSSRTSTEAFGQRSQELAQTSSLCRRPAQQEHDNSLC